MVRSPHPEIPMRTEFSCSNFVRLFPLIGVKVNKIAIPLRRRYLTSDLIMTRFQTEGYCPAITPFPISPLSSKL